MGFSSSEPSRCPCFLNLSHTELFHTCYLSVTSSGDVCAEQRAGSAHSGAARHGGRELRRADGGRGKKPLNPHK